MQETNSSFLCRSSQNYTKSARRLRGWIKQRVTASSLPWVKLDAKQFSKATGLALRTARNAIDQLRNNPEEEIVFRTVNENGRWIILCSTTAALSAAKRSEPFDKCSNGVKRRIKTHKGGNEINTEQLVLGSDPVFWGVDQAKEEATVEAPADPHEDERQMELKLLDPSAPWANLTRGLNAKDTLAQVKTWSGFMGWDVPKIVSAIPLHKEVLQKENKYKHGSTPIFNLPRLRKLAFYHSRKLKSLHWETCRVTFSGQHCFNFILKHLKRNYSLRDIKTAYLDGLREAHANASDGGTTFVASSTVASASTKLKSVKRRWR